jgi:phosphate/sulfate permease
VSIYLFLVVLLIVLAVTDLIVGVSNDAVNFLNSAIGSRVARRKTIMIVASFGILLGAVSSGGMMEVARSGVFYPDKFYFDEVMVLFVAVMLTDIFLLDIFNTFGMPTSTTVSIVFELLGAATVLAFIKVLDNNQSLANLQQYINGDNALVIVLGIFLSILFAFTLGALVQFFTRIIFTFSYRNAKSWVTVLWVSLAFSSLLFFLFLKGLNGASFMSPETYKTIESNKAYLFFGSTGILFIFFSVFKKIKDTDIFRFVVLFGTFSLAMAFAGNDLVNFIGVPIAGLESYLHWNNSGIPPGEFSMEALNEAIPAQSYFLLLAGLIMIATLWFSKKAQSVTETEVNLGRQSTGRERFKPNRLARGVVYFTHQISLKISALFPERYSSFVHSRFEDQMDTQESSEKPAFDLVRASINLTMASILIAFATSLKLPLSTTYVSFMVAMGTSLADRAWGRESAVYRISGVLNVIGGWFTTAIIAFSVSALFAFGMAYFGFWVVFVLIGLVGTVLFFTSRYHKKQTLKKEQLQELKHNETTHFTNKQKLRQAEMLHLVQNLILTSVKASNKEDRQLMVQAKTAFQSLQDEHEVLGTQLFQYISTLEKEKGRLLIQGFDFEQDLIQSCTSLYQVCENHIRNTHSPLESNQKEIIERYLLSVTDYLSEAYAFMKNTSNISIAELKGLKENVLVESKNCMDYLVQGVDNQLFTPTSTQLFLQIVLESKDIVAVSHRLLKTFIDSYSVRDCKSRTAVTKSRNEQP